MEGRPYVPVINRGIFDPTPDNVIAGVIVPLMLARHVAGLPDESLLLEQVARLRRDVSLYTQRSEEYPFTVSHSSPGVVTGIVFHPQVRKAEVIGPRVGKLEGVARVVLDPMGVHLLHGFLNFFANFLHQDWDDIPNADVRIVQEYCRLVAQHQESVTLFAVRLAEASGASSWLRGVWYPQPMVASWEWQLEGPGSLSDGIKFSLGEAVSLAGFLTIWRVAFNEWSWLEK